ncbi:MAG: DUF5652 family protein [Nanoarchaeota archaeon]
MGYLQYISGQMGIPIWFLITVIIWNLIWKLPALWISARKRQIIWFIVLAFVNTMGILEILYIFIFSRMHHHKEEQIKTIKRSRKKRI